MLYRIVTQAQGDRDSREAEESSYFLSCTFVCLDSIIFLLEGLRLSFFFFLTLAIPLVNCHRVVGPLRN